jgi:hypothetical protein
MSGRLIALLLTFLILFPFAVLGQTQVPPAQAPAPQAPVPPVSAQAPAPQASPAQTNDRLAKPEELDALVAPIALYPDSLLSLVLMASTYPIEVIQADRWIKANKNLKGEALKEAADKEPWDESVKSLAASPDVLSMMSSKLEWTLMLGDAVLAQQPDVMDAIQRLRSRADANNKLTSTKEQRVTKTQSQSGRQFIAIEQTNPETLYVPYYDPAVAYGSWPYPAYPPYYFGYPGYIGAGLIATGLAFGAGWALGRWASGGNYWGGGINWNNNINNININRPRVNPLNGNNWQHRPEHRQGVRYNNSNVRQQFGNNNIRGGAQNRTDFRGRPSAGQRPGAGQRPSGRPGAGQRPSGRPSAGQRPSGRPSAGQRPAGRPSAGQRPAGGYGGGNALGNIGSGRAANLQGARGRASIGGGGFRGGGGGGFRGGGGGRRSDIRFKHDIVLLGHLPNGLGYYRFSYNGSDSAYVGVMAQEVQMVMPKAVTRDRDGSLRVLYERLGLKFQTYEEWIRTGAQIPVVAHASH